MTLRRPSKQTTVLTVIAFIAITVAAAIAPARAFLRRSRTAANLQHIGLALMCYHEKHGSYPPQYLVDQQGKPAHSWRVLVLPFLGYDKLYRRYRFDEPWNGPHNRLLATEMPEEYRSPFQDSQSTTTQYVGVVGRDTPWQGMTSLREGELQRGFLDPLIWFVEAANSDINWMEPRDIPLEQALAGINIPGGRGVTSNYSYAIPAQMVPLGCDWVPVGITSGAFRAMLTVAPKQ